MTDSTFKLIPTRLQFLGVLSVCLLFSPLIADEDGWKEVKSKNGITVYEKEVDGRTAFRGTCEMIGSPEKLVGILHNPDRWNEWIENLEEGSLVEKKSDFHLIFRQVIDAPFPTTNRELVFESIVFSC